MTRIPKGADLVVNKVSGAPGIWLGNVIVMAGVPSIMQAMLDEVAPKLKTGIRMLSQTVRADAREGDIGTQLGQIAKANPDVAIGSYPFFDPQHGPNTNVVLRARDPQKLATATRAVEDMNPRLILLALWTFLAGILPVSAQQSDTRVALLIGNAAYPDAEAPLRDPVNNVRSLADELRRTGFDVDIGENLTKEAMRFAPDLLQNLGKGDANLLSVLDEADAYVARNGLELPEEPQARRTVRDADCVKNPILSLDLAGAGIATIIWATGFTTDYSWLNVDTFDEKGRPRHQRGVSAEPGIYFLGLPWQSRRGSSFIWGVWHDAKYLADQITIQRNYMAYHEAASRRR